MKVSSFNVIILIALVLYIRRLIQLEWVFYSENRMETCSGSHNTTMSFREIRRFIGNINRSVSNKWALRTSENISLLAASLIWSDTVFYSLGSDAGDDDDDDDDWCFTATFVHKVGYMGRATSKGNEAKSSKTKQPSDMPTPRFEHGR